MNQTKCDCLEIDKPLSTTVKYGAYPNTIMAAQHQHSTFVQLVCEHQGQYQPRWMVLPVDNPAVRPSSA